MVKIKTTKKNKEIAIYKDSKGNIDFRIDNDKETLWATQAGIAMLFDVQRPAITKHLLRNQYVPFSNILHMKVWKKKLLIFCILL